MKKNEAKRKAWKTFFIFFPIGLIVLAMCIWGISTKGFLEFFTDDMYSSLGAAFGMLCLVMMLIGAVMMVFDVRRAKAVTTGEIISVLSPEEESATSESDKPRTANYKCHFTYMVNGQEYEGSENVTPPKEDPDRIYDYLHTKINVYYDPKHPEKNWPIIPPLDKLKPQADPPEQGDT